MIGADVYVIADLGARSLGPAQLVAWAVARILAALIGLAFVQCAAICPQVGGSYAYALAAFGPLVGFLAGWALYLGESVALPVFPLACVNYLGEFGRSNRRRLDCWSRCCSSRSSPAPTSPVPVPVVG